MGLWYSKDSGFELIVYSDADLAGCNDDCKSTSGGIQFLGDKLVNILHLPVETPENPFVAPVNIETIKAFMNKVGYQGVVDKDYHSIKDNISLVSVYTTRDVCVRGMLIPDVFLTEEIRATNDFKEYEMMFVNDIIERERDAIAEATLLSLALHKTALAAKAQENVAKIQEKLDDEEIEKWLKVKKMKSHMQKLEDIEIEKEKKDGEIEKEKNNDNVEETDKVVREKDIADDGTGSKEIKKEQNHTPIPSPTRSPRNVSSSDKTVYEELAATISPTTATTSKDSSTTKRKKRSFSHKTKILLGIIAGIKIRETLDHCNKVVPDITFAKTKEIIIHEMPRLVNLAVTKDHEIDPINAKDMITKEFATHRPKMIEELFQKHMQNTTLNLYPTTSSSTAGKSSTDLQYQLYLNMKSNQDQAADTEIWEILKAKSPQKSLKITIRQQKVVEREKDDDDSEDRLEPGSHKDKPEYVDDDDDKYAENVDEEEGGEMGSLETRTEEMQTPIPIKHRSPRTILSLDNNITQELTKTIPLLTTTTSNTSHSKRRISSKYNHLPGALRKMCRRQGYIIQNMEWKCVTTKQFWKTHKQVNQVLHQGVSQLAKKATKDLIETNLKPCIAAMIIEDRDAFRLEVPDLVSQEFNTQAPKIIEDLFKNYIQSNVIQVHPTTTTSTKTISSADLQQQLYFKMKRSLQDRANDPALWEDDAPPKGEKRVKRHKASKSSKSARGSSSKHSAKDSKTYVSKQQQQQEWDAWVEETVIDEDEVIPKDETPELITELQDVDKHVPTIFDYERMKATLNDALSNQFKNAEEITEVVKITIDQPYGLDFMEQIIVMRGNDKPDSFFEADFKYLNKNDIEDFRVIWERVHDFQLGIESYQIKVNLTAPTLTFPGIEAHEPYSIVDKPSTGLIYLNSKDEKQVMYLKGIVKFCDATLEKVLKEVKLKIFQSEPWRKQHLLGELDRDILRAFKREITKRLSHREQMRRWESFVNGRPILPTMKRL
ncbi:hypothetical protein Tco_0385516 [Tanacetum coccineum]